MSSLKQRADADVARAARSLEEHEQHLKSVMADKLIEECIERLGPILTHERPASTMRVPVDFDHDDDVFILGRLHEVLRRLRLENER